MEIDAESLRIRYEQMETEELVELYRRGYLTELAFGVLDQALHERGVASSVIQPKLGHPSCLCNAKLVEDGHKLGLIMSNARLREVLANWRDRRADAVTALLIAACGYAAIAAAGVTFIGYVDSKLVQIVVALFVAASGFAAAMRLFSVVEEALGNERVRHMKAVLKAGGYPAAEVAAADAARAGVPPTSRPIRTTRRYPTPPPKVINVRPPATPSVDNIDVANDYRKNHGMPGVVYILDNQAFRAGIYKIGCSRRSGAKRAEELNRDANTGTPAEFRCIFECSTTNCGLAEERIHAILHDKRRKKFGKKLGKNESGTWGQEYFDVDLNLAKRTIATVCRNIDHPPQD